MKKFSSQGSGQSFTDRMTAAKHSISGSGLAKVVCKATTEEIMAPKQKHLSYLIECTRESNVSIPELANTLLERLNNSSWTVVFKALVTIHHLMNYGNERFTQYLASNNCRLSLPNFMDKTTQPGMDMSRFIRRYSNYVQEKALTYRQLAFDFCKVKRGAEDAALRSMSVERLMRSLPALIEQFDALLAFDVTAGELCNGIINAAFVLLYKDASRLFVVFNDGIINLLTKFFEAMSKKQCREALDIYKKFLDRSERLAEFSRIAESAGVERADLTLLEKHPTSFLDAMEGHLGHLEGKKISRSSSSNSVGSVGASASAVTTAAQLTGSALTEAQKQLLLQEEQQILDKIKAEREKKSAAPTVAPSQVTSAQTSAPATAAAAAAVEFDAFDAPLSYAPSSSANAFSDAFGQSAPLATQPQLQMQPMQPVQQTQPMHQMHQMQPSHQSMPFDPFGAVLEPSKPTSASVGGGGGGGGSIAVGSGQPAATRPAITSDLDATLATLASSLGVKDGGRQLAGRQGGQQAAATSSANHVPIAAGPTVNWGAQQQQQQQQFSYYQQQQYPGFAFGHQQHQHQQQHQQQQYGAGSAYNPFMPAGWASNPAAGAAMTTATNPSDPFGAL